MPFRQEGNADGSSVTLSRSLREQRRGADRTEVFLGVIEAGSELTAACDVET